MAGRHAAASRLTPLRLLVLLTLAAAVLLVVVVSRPGARGPHAPATRPGGIPTPSTTTTDGAPSTTSGTPSRSSTSAPAPSTTPSASPAGNPPPVRSTPVAPPPTNGGGGAADYKARQAQQLAHGAAPARSHDTAAAPLSQVPVG